MDKRGQVATFIILGLVLLFLIGFLFYARQARSSTSNALEEEKRENNKGIIIRFAVKP